MAAETRQTSTDRAGYFLCDLLAAGLVLVSLTQAFDIGATLIQLFFLAMSVVGIVSRLHPLRRLRLAPAAQPIRWSRPRVDQQRL